ncbi:hypothetical protein HK097_007515 [Rhizophlyctis rosea]|uniref:Ribosomal protein bL31m N-terminal domain-containing protein n=1 Tax=Rhizophlyctis rosea TaxID=64517 RepID=A0AAD5X269_9FUNG|nr:hypothetical protein HK097_007515 [Rhizophlyctis rosea]
MNSLSTLLFSSPAALRQQSFLSQHFLHSASLTRHTCTIRYSSLQTRAYRKSSRSNQPTSRPTGVNPPLFHQTVLHSDGSSFTFRTTSPRAFLQMTKDARNHPLWNPSVRRVDDQAGELARFSQRFADLGDDLLEGLGFVEGFEDPNAPKKKEVVEEVPVVPAAGGKKKKK